MVLGVLGAVGGQSGSRTQGRNPALRRLVEIRLGLEADGAAKDAAINFGQGNPMAQLYRRSIFSQHRTQTSGHTEGTSHKPGEDYPAIR